MPDKWHGVADREIKYRKRHLDLMSNEESAAVFVIRSRMVAEMRAFFHERGFLEVETPMLQDIPGGAAARPFETFHNALGMPLTLRIAPERYGHLARNFAHPQVFSGKKLGALLPGWRPKTSRRAAIEATIAWMDRHALVAPDDALEDAIIAELDELPRRVRSASEPV